MFHVADNCTINHVKMSCVLSENGWTAVRVTATSGRIWTWLSDLQAASSRWRLRDVGTSRVLLPPISLSLSYHHHLAPLSHPRTHMSIAPREIGTLIVVILKAVCAQNMPRP